MTGLVVAYLVIKPKDDLAVTSQQLQHIRRSVIKQFTHIDQYEISEIKSIRCGGIHTDSWELIDFFSGGGKSGGYSNTVEISFKDGQSKSIELAIGRKELDHIVKLIDKQKELQT